jgi:excisionase family DNA binding protein
MSNTTSVLFTTGEVASRFRVSSGTVRNLVSRGDLIPVRIGDRLLFNEDELSRFERVGVRSISTKPIDRDELDSFIASIDSMTHNTLGIVMENYRRELDNKSDLDRISIMERLALKLAEDVMATTETKRKAGESRTDFERLTVRYLGRAMQLFGALLKTEQTA